MKNLRKNIRFGLLITIAAISLQNQSDANNTKSEALSDDQLKAAHAITVQKNLPLHEIILNMYHVEERQNHSVQEKIKLMQNVLDHKAVDINKEDADGKTALVLATFYNADPTIIKFLIDNGAKVNQPDRFNETPLHNAIRNDEIQSAELLLEASADPDLKNDTLETPIDLARSPNTQALFGLE